MLFCNPNSDFVSCSSVFFFTIALFVEIMSAKFSWLFHMQKMLISLSCKKGVSNINSCRLLLSCLWCYFQTGRNQVSCVMYGELKEEEVLINTFACVIYYLID